MSNELEQLINSASDLPTIPAVAFKVLQLIETQEVGADELARLVASDPAVAARVLKISNSSFYGCQRKIQTLPHAIMMLGYNTLRSVVVAASVKQVYSPYGLTEQMLWEHSFGAGLAARIIANAVGTLNEEEAFLGGLFHDIGKIILNHLEKEKFQAVMELSYNNGIPFSQAERHIYPYTHAEVGGLVIRKWNFPDMLMKAVLRHHLLDPDVDEDPYQTTLTAVVALADVFCHRLGVGLMEAEPHLVLHESRPARLLGLDRQRLESLLVRFQVLYEENKEFFD